MGARQVGKSTLAQAVAKRRGFESVLTLDDAAQRRFATEDPIGFLARFTGPVLIDEVQRAPDLLLEIKRRVDEDRAPGQYLLTGSANVFTAPKVQDALTGRMGTVELWPLSQAEIESRSTSVIDDLFAGTPPVIAGAPIGRSAFTARVLRGGYPEVLGFSADARADFFEHYIDGTLRQDLAALADIRRLDEVPALVRHLAAQSSGLLSVEAAANRLGLAADTVRTYATLLETLFVLRLIPAWRPGLHARTVHAPKVSFVDSGLLAALLGADEARITNDDQLTGPLLENFVASEIGRLLSVASVRARQYHYRAGRTEIDVVLESAAGDLVAIEAKASATVSPRDARALVALRDQKPQAFRAGIVLHAGPETVQFSDRIWALPFSALWS